MRFTRPRPLDRAPLVTVVIPHFNYGAYLPMALESVLTQRGVELEVIIVDDASTDGSTEVARTLAAQDDRVTLVAHEKNMRHIATYNDGLGRATGDYVVLLSADDALAPGSLARSVALLEAHPEVGLVYGYTREFETVPPAIGDPRPTWTIWSGEDWISTVCTRGRNIIQTPEAIMRRDVFEQIGGYDAAFPHSGDMLMWMQAASRAGVGRVNGAVQAFYRQHGSNMHSVQFGGLLDDMGESLKTFDHFFDTDGKALPHADRLRRTAHGALAREVLRASVLLEDGPERAAQIGAMKEFAEDAAPEVRRSASWRWYSAVGESRHGSLTRRSARFAERVRWWQRGHKLRLLGI
jgi:hypothetical protein